MSATYLKNINFFYQKSTKKVAPNPQGNSTKIKAYI